MKAITITITVSLLALAFWVSVGTGTTVRYEPPDQDNEFVRLVRMESPPKPEAIDEKQRVYSPHRTRWFRVDVSPGTLPYDQRIGRVQIAGPNAFGRTISFSNFKLHNVRWINEELIYLEIWHGRVLATEHIFDVEAAKPIYQKTVFYSNSG